MGGGERIESFWVWVAFLGVVVSAGGIKEGGWRFFGGGGVVRDGRVGGRISEGWERGEGKGEGVLV